MYIDRENKVVVINDSYIYEFMAEHDSDDFSSVCESILKSICLACSHNFKKDNFQVEQLINRLNTSLSEFKGEFIEANKKIDLTDITRVVSETSTITSMKLDHIKDQINTAKIIEDNNNIHQSIERLSDKIERAQVFKSTNRNIGEKGERGLIDALENVLPLREGYSVIETKALPHNCDINVKRIGYPDIHIESKAHGSMTGEPVRTKEVKKFEYDLIGLNSHGIFVSLYSDICGKGQVEIDLLHTNKFAIYLSNNNFDGSIIKDFISLVYKLDSIIMSKDESFKITTESMTTVKNYLTDFSNKITILKTSMKSNLAMLNEISFDVIEKILLGNMPKPINEIKEATTGEVHACDVCNRTYTSSKGLKIHKHTCAKTPNQ